MNGNGDRSLRMAWAFALVFHFVLFVMVFPESANTLTGTSPDRDIVVIKPYRPPQPPVERPTTAPIRRVVNPVPIPDPTPDDPEPIVSDEVVYEIETAEKPDGEFVVGAPTGPPPPQAPAGPVRAGIEVEPPELLSRVAPIYPELARRAHMACTVILESTIAVDGSVADSKVLRGCELGFDEAAIEAVSQWRYRPTFYNGRAVPVVLTVTVIFQLQR